MLSPDEAKKCQNGRWDKNCLDLVNQTSFKPKQIDKKNMLERNGFAKEYKTGIMSVIFVGSGENVFKKHYLHTILP